MKASEASPVGECPKCRKLRFRSRKACRAHARKVHPGEPLQVYECEGYFHYGHSPYVVMRGVIARNQLLS